MICAQMPKLKAVAAGEYAATSYYEANDADAHKGVMRVAGRNNLEEAGSKIDNTNYRRRFYLFDE